MYRFVEATMPRRSLAVLAGLALAVPLVILAAAAPAGADPGPRVARSVGVHFAIRRPSPIVLAQLHQTGVYGTLTTDR
jgi:hypothetical protein